MSNIMQYLIQMTDDFRESYDEIKRMQAEQTDAYQASTLELTDKVDTLTYTVRELEDRININLRNDKKV